MKTTSRAVPLGDSGVTVIVQRDQPTSVRSVIPWTNNDADTDLTDREAIALRDALVERYPLTTETDADPGVCGHRWDTAAHGHELQHVCVLRADHAIGPDFSRTRHRCACYAQLATS